MEVETLDWEPDRAAELLSRDQPTLFMVGSGVEGPLCSNPPLTLRFLPRPQ